MRIVLDTNCLLVALPQNSPYRCIWDAFRSGKLILCYTTEIIQEYEELLSKHHAPETVFLTIELLLKLPNVLQITPFYKWNLISNDPDDNKFVDCALNAGADFIVTNDKHFNILRDIEFPKVDIIDIETFKKTIAK